MYCMHITQCGMSLCGGAWSIARHARPLHGMAGSPRMCFHIRSSPQVIHSLAFALCPVAISPGNLVWRGSHPGHRTTSRLTQELCITRLPCTFVQPTLPIYSLYSYIAYIGPLHSTVLRVRTSTNTDTNRTFA